MNLKNYMKLKKILVVIDETNFYHPQFFYDLYRGLNQKIMKYQSD